MRRRLPRSLGLTVAAVAVAGACGVACAGGGHGRATDPPVAGLRAASERPLEPSLARRHARYFPLRTRDLAVGERMLLGGVRLLGLPAGGVASAGELLPSPPSQTIELPTRLGGGFLFRMGGAIHRASSWLAALVPVFAAPPTSPLANMFVGLDRIYAQLATGALIGLDPQTGKDIGLGALPLGPSIGGFVTIDGWRALAIVDTRGLVATEDAGATWSRLSTPGTPAALVREGELVGVRHRGTSLPTTSWFSANADGHIVEATAPAPHVAEAANRRAKGKQNQAAHEVDEHEVDDDDDAENGNESGSDHENERFSRAKRPLFASGRHPLAAAIEDGWSLSDDSALVAGNGQLGRVRLSDGVVVETVVDAFPLTHARCHSLSLARSARPRDFGFVCGEARGRTDVYAFDASRSAMVLLKRFDFPRQVVPSGNGALVVRGACASDAPSDDPSRTAQTYCVRGHDDVFRDFSVHGDIGSERVVALADGRVVVLSPPNGTFAGARLTLFDHGAARTIAVVFEPEPMPTTPEDQRDADALARVLRFGAWLNGFEERRPGVLSGWVMSSSSALGVEISLGGRAKRGGFVRDLLAPIVAGAFGVGWSGHRGYETTDGGTTWRPVALPAPLGATSIAAGARSCGPLGCTSSGWLRLGWGQDDLRTGIAQATPIAARTPPQTPILLHCNLSEPPRSFAATSASSLTGGGPGLLGLPPPIVTKNESVYALEGSATLERGRWETSTGPLGQLYAWGPRSAANWEAEGHAILRFSSPFEASASARSTQQSAIPRFLAEAFVPTLSQARAGLPVFSSGLAFTDDGSEALWTFQRAGSRGETAGALVARSSGGVVTVRSADDEPIGNIEAAVHVGERWYLATADPTANADFTIVWEVHDGIARQLARLPRVGLAAPPGPVRLARAADGKAIGVVIDGQPGAARYSSAQRWLVPIDLQSGIPRAPELLGDFDLANAATPCGPDAGGWMMDTTFKNPLTLDLSGVAVRVTPSLARLHVSAGAACIDRIASLNDIAGDIGRASAVDLKLARSAVRTGAVTVTVMTGASRRRLLCTP